MKPYLVDTPDGKTITIEGPDDATDDELIAIAQKSFNSNAKPAGKTKPPVDTRGDNLSLPVDRTSRDIPDVGTAESLISDMKKGDATLQNAAPAAFKEIEKAGSAPPARGSINQKIAEGDLEGAWNSLTNFEKGTLAASVPVLAYGGYKIADKFLGGEKAEKPSVRVEPTGGLPDGGGNPPNNIKSRTFEAGNYGSTSMGTAPKGMSAKEIQVATDIKDRFGYDINDLKNQFGVSDVPITDITQAEILATNARNKELAAAETPKTPVIEAPPAAPVEEIKPAPVAETPKALAPPTEAVPQAAVPPPQEKKKGGRPTASSMEGTTFRPDLGPGDNWLYNTAGPERRKLILQEFNEGKPAKNQETAVRLYQEYKKKYPKDMFGPVIPTDVAIERGVKPPENYGKLGKAAKVAGVAGLALTAAEMANAAQKSSKGDNAPLRESLFNLLGMIPGLGTAFSAATYSGGLNENEAADLARRRQLPPTITKR